jgi:hypothetical protein
VVKAGSVLVLHKDGLMMYGIDDKVAPTSTYKDGKLSMGFGALMSMDMQLGLVQDGLNHMNVPQRKFVDGEKFWVTSITVKDDGVILMFYSDPIDDVRYFGQVKFPFGKKVIPSADEMAKSIAEVVTVQTEDNAQATEPGQPPASGAVPQPVAIPATPKGEIQKRLEALIVLSKVSADRTDLVKPGSIVELRKDGMLMWSVDTAVPPVCILKDGKLTMPFALRAKVGAELRGKQPGTNDYEVPHRTFVAGEKAWVMGTKITDTGVFLQLYSDPFADVRYYGIIWFQFPKGTIPAADDVMKSVADVISVEPPPVDTAAAPAPSAPPPPIIAPVAPPPPPPDAAPAQPKTVALGQSKDMVVAILGQPSKVAIVGPKEIDYYQDMKVIFIKGKVTDIQ